MPLRFCTLPLQRGRLMPRDELFHSPTLLTDLHASVLMRLSKAFAPSTFARHSYLTRCFGTFLAHTELQPDQHSALMFLEWLSIGITIPTLRTYAVTFLSLYPHLKSMDSQVWLRSLTHFYGANVPSRQASPLTVAELQELLTHLPTDPKWAVWLAWKTASRWADVANLTPDDFTLVELNVLLVSFKDKTKGSHDRPFRPDLLVLVEDPMVPQFMAWMRLQNSLTTKTTVQLSRLMQEILARHVTAHSIKRGVLNFLATLVADGQLPVHIIPQLAKHAVPWALPEKTVRYLSDKPAIAKMMGSREATKLIPSLPFR